MIITLKPIGWAHSPFKTTADIDPMKYANSHGFDAVEGELEIEEEFQEGLSDIEGFSHIFVIFGFHKSETFKLKTIPLLEDTPKGIFSTRSPHRPNPLGLTVMRILERRANILHVAGMDLIDETPILDIKPYTSRDQKDNIKIGWLSDKIK
jgi:tRNA-Thr(GGU) m(6)t(6)A37 methyltransferase TsaA